MSGFRCRELDDSRIDVRREPTKGNLLDPDELLDPGAVEGFTDIEVAVGIHGDGVSGNDVSSHIGCCDIKQHTLLLFLMPSLLLKVLGSVDISVQPYENSSEL